MKPPTEAAEQLTMAAQADCRALIAALKIQRWDVTKWTMTVNIALAAASATLGDAKWVIALVAVLVAMLGVFLVWHYNERITRVRETLRKIAEYVRINIFDINAAIGVEFSKEKSRNYDQQELVAFPTAILVSALPALIVLVAIK